MENQTFISPFSYNQHSWKLDWRRIASNEKYDRPYETQSEKEQRALEAIASVGVIGGLQLRKLFDLDKQKVKRMEARKLIVRHEIKKNDIVIPIYTIGRSGANKVMPEFVQNYWVEYDTKAVLNRMLFFQLCILFGDIKVRPSPSPFIASIKMNGNEFYVYATRGNINDLMMFLKWKPIAERIIIITEDLNHLRPLKPFIFSDKMKVRAITDNEIQECTPRFYRLAENNKVNELEWLLE
ncbi:hypothetical protein [Ornithinibacillus contaminans]|uniref:hypothetical protein n=1 Tax=Ornithinibacillus contaminans TaxID=694055 RepID=UPI0012ED68B2|nr:hypothetical protein [Ornithinibacillus contaminans]